MILAVAVGGASECYFGFWALASAGSGLLNAVLVLPLAVGGLGHAIVGFGFG